jgi:hypothetical protein
MLGTFIYPMTAKETALAYIEEQKKQNKFAPVLLTETFGDGQKLIYYSTLDHRGEYWLVLVDSNSDLSASGEFGRIAENEISLAKEEEFGTKYDEYCECDNCKNGEECEGNPYPALSYHGCNWGEIDFCA